MKPIAILIAIIGIAFLTRTSRNTPFLRYGLIVALLGSLVFVSPVLFAARAIPLGLAFFVAGSIVYYYGRLFRGERFFLSKP